MLIHCPDPNSDPCADERLNDTVFFFFGETLNDTLGSAYYVAPEVLHTSYSLEARRYMEHWSYNLRLITWKLAFLGAETTSKL